MHPPGHRANSGPLTGDAGPSIGPTRLALTVALIACVVLSVIRLPLAGIPDLLEPPGRLLPVWPQTLIWMAVGLLWGVGARWIYKSLGRRGHRAEVFQGSSAPPPITQDHRHMTAALWLCVSAVLSALILPTLLVGQWTLQPFQLWLGLYATYGMAGAFAAAGWLLYHCGFAVLVALALAVSQSLFEALVRMPLATKIPVGGVVVGLIGGLSQVLVGGFPAFVTALVACIMLGGVHLLTGRRLRWTAPATALVLIFL